MAGYVADGYVQPGYVSGAAPPPPPQPPAIIILGAPGAALHSLPMRTLGGSVADLDLLYGVLGKEGIEDIQPFFVLGSRVGALRYFGYEIPRQAIQDAVIEHYATLLSIGDLSIEANPAGNNLFGFVALTTLPFFTVTLNNQDGYWSQFIVRELLVNSPAAVYVDIGHTVASAVVRGTISEYDMDGQTIVLTGGIQARRHQAPSVRD